MDINNTLLKKLETLSSLEIEDAKRELMIKSLSEIVSFVDNLNELDLEKHKATFTTVDTNTPFREDVAKVDKETIKIILENAPKSDDTSFIVPKIIE